MKTGEYKEHVSASLTLHIVSAVWHEMINYTWNIQWVDNRTFLYIIYSQYFLQPVYTFSNLSK